jgi:acyl-CoA reductase-like NAD-dependent aldehyde dehydrogenase
VIDSLYKLFVEDKAVILKMNPVNEYIGPILEDVFHTLIDMGFMRITYGGVEEGAFLCRHDNIDEIHLTGSAKIFDAIVFGSGQEGIENKRNRKPILTKYVSAELGNVTPVIIIPGPWGFEDIQRQAMQIASWLVTNAGFNCLTPRVIIQHRNWKYRDNFVEAISNILAEIDTRTAYYPGAKERQRAFVSEHPDARQLGAANNDRLPWTFISNVDSRNKNDICFKDESFCGLLAETALEAPTPAEFIKRAVEFANETLWGSLTSTVIVHPKSLQVPEIAVAVEQAIAKLHYGSVCINLRAEYAYAMMVTTWGAFPGHDISDIQSGRGVVNNLLMFGRPQIKLWPDPSNITSIHLPMLGKAMARFEASPSPWRLASLIWSGLQVERSKRQLF